MNFLSTIKKFPTYVKIFHFNEEIVSQFKQFHISYIMEQLFVGLSNEISFLFRTINLRYSSMRRKERFAVGQIFFIDLFLFFRHNNEFRYLIGIHTISFWNRRYKPNENLKLSQKYKETVSYLRITNVMIILVRLHRHGIKLR